MPWHAGVVRRVPLVPQATATTIPFENLHNQLRLTRVAQKAPVGAVIPPVQLAVIAASALKGAFRQVNQPLHSV